MTTTNPHWRVLSLVYKALSEWREQHPEHIVSDTPDYEAWYSISRNMCNTDPAALNKLVRHLAAVTAVEKKDATFVTGL